MILRSTALEVTVLPEIGGKIARIRRMPNGQDVLIPPQRALQSLPETAARWVNYDTSGMDDCFPNVDEGEHPDFGVRLPQLGEWVYGGWAVAESSPEIVVLERMGRLLPYAAVKRVSFAAPDALRLEYTVRNTGERAFSYLWSAHPLLAVGEEFEISLPGMELEYVTYPRTGGPCHWPYRGAVNFTREWIPRGQTLKLFVTGIAEGWCELHQPQSSIRFTFDPAATPVLGVWFNNFGFPTGSPFRCIAVEPCTSASDTLHELPANSRRMLAPGESAQWWLTMEIQIR